MSKEPPKRSAGSPKTSGSPGSPWNADAAEPDRSAGASGPARTRGIAHIGIAVRDLDEALRLYHETLGLPLHGRETVESDGVNVAFLPAGDTELELLEATDPESPVARFIEQRGEGIHHIALEVDDVAETLKTLRGRGYRLIDEEPRIGAGGVRVAFVHPRSTNGVLIELCEKGGADKP